VRGAKYRRGDTVTYRERGLAYVVQDARLGGEGWLYTVASACGRMADIPEVDLALAVSDRRMEEQDEEEGDPWLT
jgi:hypothetical protein